MLADPDLSQELSRAYVLEDVCNLLAALMGVACRLRAWAALEQVKSVAEGVKASQGAVEVL